MTRHFVSCLMLVSLLTYSSVGVGDDKFFESGGVKLRYVEEGSGATVFLVHGYRVDLGIWTRSEIFQRLSRQYRVVALDLRGHGLSAKPHDPDMYGVELANDIIRLMDHLEIGQAHIVGYSMGGRLTGYLLANHPDRLLSAVIAAAAPRRHWGDEEDQYVDRSMRINANRAKTAAPGDTRDWQAMDAVARSWKEITVSESKLRANRLPSLAVVGSEDPMAEGFDELSEITPKMKFVLVDGATHFDDQNGLIWQPVFSDLIFDFLAEQ